jgi:hypothetical protein
MSEASDAIKELSLEARLEDTTMDELLRSASVSAPAMSGADIQLVPPAPTGRRVTVDKTLLLLAIAEIGASLSERAARAGEGTKAEGPTIIPLSVDEPETATVRLLVGDWVRPLDDAAVKAPFAISGGGIRLALARTLTQMAGGGLRLEQSPEGSLRYAIHFPKRV